MLKVGLRVKMNPSHSDYDVYIRQHKGDDGVVVDEYSHSSSRVRWDNGHTSVYADNSLIILDEEYLKKQEEINKMYEIPFLPGQRVCLNPESEEFGRINKYAKGNAGNVLYVDITYIALKKWSTRSDKPNVCIKVKFDNGQEIMCRHKNLLPIDAKPKTVTQYNFKSGATLYCVEGDESMIKIIETEVIFYGNEITSKEIYDNEWRAEIVQQISNNITPTQSIVVMDEFADLAAEIPFN